MRFNKRKVIRRTILWFPLIALVWLFASIWEWRTGQRLFPWSAYQFCGDNPPSTLPTTVKVGFYEEFPVPWRLEKLKQLDFPVKLAIAAASRQEFEKLHQEIDSTYPQVREIYFWPLLSADEGYYPGSWSNADAVERVAHEADNLPTLWDLEMWRNRIDLSFEDWKRNRMFLDDWLRQHKEPVHIWRSNRTMGLDPLFLCMVAMHFDPLTYPSVSLHLDLYMTGSGLDAQQITRIVRCGVERYGKRFIPSLGVLNDGEGDPGYFISPELLRRNLQLVRAAGVHEVWLFGSNGLNSEIISMLHETLPLEKLH